MPRATIQSTMAVCLPRRDPRDSRCLPGQLPPYQLASVTQDCGRGTENGIVGLGEMALSGPCCRLATHRRCKPRLHWDRVSCAAQRVLAGHSWLACLDSLVTVTGLRGPLA